MKQKARTSTNVFPVSLLGLLLVTSLLTVSAAEDYAKPLARQLAPANSAHPTSVITTPTPQVAAPLVLPLTDARGTGREAPEVVASDARGVSLSWPASAWISTYFHERGPYWVGGYHQGVDIAVDLGMEVRAAAHGVVIGAETGWNRGYGTFVLLDHGHGVHTLYAHLLRLAVEEGQRVDSGQLVGYVGTTGASAGPHLHFEVRIDGELRDPLLYLP